MSKHPRFGSDLEGYPDRPMAGHGMPDDLAVLLLSRGPELEPYAANST